MMASSTRNTEAMEEDTLRFQIEEEDLEAVLVSAGDGEEGIDDRWCLVGKFLSNRVIDFEKMQNILASLWQLGMGILWTYDRMQLIIERLNVGGDPKSLPLNTLDIWVQLHNVEPGWTPTVAMATSAAGNGESSSVNAEDFSAPNPVVNGAAVQVEAIGRSGGLALLWKNQDEVLVDSFSENHIDSTVMFEGQRDFRFTGVFGIIIYG
uniref:DUF4283 domain-containing protein n=1 Tax=Cannabis sativa TaxID=3483 RepID=A0A803P3C0_CANSA